MQGATGEIAHKFKYSELSLVRIVRSTDIITFAIVKVVIKLEAYKRCIGKKRTAQCHAFNSNT